MGAGRGREGLTLLLGDGQGRFTTLTGSPFATGRIPNRVATGDIDGNGVADIAVSSPDDDAIHVFLMQRGETAPTSRKITVPGKPKGVAIHDLNGDGKADIVTTNNADNTLTVLLSE